MPPKRISKKASIAYALSQATSVSAPASGEFACRTEPLILVDNFQETEDQIQIANRNSATFFVLYSSYCLADDNQLGLKSRSTKDKSNKGATSAEAIRRNNTLFREFKNSGQTVSEFAAARKISASIIYRRMSDLHHGHGMRGKRQKLRIADGHAISEKVGISQKQSAAISLPGVMEVADELAQARGSGFASGVPSKRSAKKVLKVIISCLLGDCYFCSS
jgi:hypothetical protein